MHLHSYRLKNFRRLQDVHVALASDISIFVGANNSGKTSATQAIQMFLAGSKERFSLFDFNSHSWTRLKAIEAAEAAQDANALLPSISLDLWLEVNQQDLQLVIPLLPSMQWEGKLVGIRISFEASEPLELLHRFRAQKQVALERAEALEGGAGNYVPWPRSLSAYLEKELHKEYELRYFVLDRAQFNDSLEQNEGYVPPQLAGDSPGSALLKSLVRVDCLNAQRHLADPSSHSSTGGGRAEDLSKRLSRFYERNLEKHEDDHSALKALFESEEGLNKHLMAVFEPTLQRIATLGYPGLHNPRLEIKSALNPASVMSQDAKVHYILGEGDDAVHLPDSYNGLGFKNLIYMVVEILDLQAKWISEEESRAPLHLIFIEEPEAHLHAQLQQVFIRKVLTLLEHAGDAGGIFSSQVVVTTHSPHILYERGFAPIRYFRRQISEGQQTTQVLNLSSFQPGPEPKDRDFLQRYLKLTHCDLFFADAAILVEGNVERLLLPLMIEREANALRSASICILEVGGAFGHRFKGLLEFLGITTLVITDLDSVLEVAAPDVENEDEEKEFEVPGVGEGAVPVKRLGTTCLPNAEGAVTANQTLIQWLPRRRTIAELCAMPADGKFESLAGSETAKVRIAYQVPTEVSWNGATALLCGRTLEESFGLENADWCQSMESRPIGLKLKAAPAGPAELAQGLHKRVTGKNFDKTKFALGVLARSSENWRAPTYIREGLVWLAEQIDIDVEQEAAAGAGAGGLAIADAQAPNIVAPAP